MTEIESPLLAGRELDVAVAEKVMGVTPEVREAWLRDVWKTFTRRNAGAGMLGNEPFEKLEPWRAESFIGSGLDYQHPPLIPRYSTDIAAAWQVINRFHDGCGVVRNGGSDQWGAQIWLPPTATTGQRYIECFADTAPLAICRAALAAVGAA